MAFAKSQELRRIATYATALGYHNFASVFAEVIERRVGGIPEENRVTLQTAAKVLRWGGEEMLWWSVTWLGTYLV